MRLPLALLPAGLIMALFFAAFAVFAAVSVMTLAPGNPGYALPMTSANYLRFVSDGAALQTLAGTLVFSLELTAASILLGYPFAYLIARTPRRVLRQFLLGAVILTFLSGSISRAYGWLLILGRRGMLNGLLLSAGVIDRPIGLIYSWTGVFVALLHFTIPYFVLTVFGSIQNVPSNVEESARDLGASGLSVFIRITLPLTLRAVVNGATLVFSLGISAFVFPLLLGGGRVQLVSNLIYDQLFVSFDLPFAAAISVLFLAVSLLTLLSFGVLERLVLRREIVW